MNMIEKVARAICREFYIEYHSDTIDALVDEMWHDDNTPEFCTMAKAAIKAIREPSADMVEAMIHPGPYGTTEAAGIRGHSVVTWAAMIDAALEES